MNHSPFSFSKHIEELKKIFSPLKTAEERYKKIIQLGALLPLFSENDKISENLVPGCQSLLYIKASLEKEAFVFTAYSDALISKGLAALLYKAYSGLPPEVVIQHPPVFLKEYEIITSLTPARSNGVLSLYLKMQQLALTLLTFK